ncbi:hypothetical protein C8J57DRAFT_1243972 [Mycena rebaudengoi]|nr:hypothetical protein C8J57DRAFT_1243972 [Mycena rebaudengoi]
MPTQSLRQFVLTQEIFVNRKFKPTRTGKHAIKLTKKAAEALKSAASARRNKKARTSATQSNAEPDNDPEHNSDSDVEILDPEAVDQADLAFSHPMLLARIFTLLLHIVIDFRRKIDVEHTSTLLIPLFLLVWPAITSRRALTTRDSQRDQTRRPSGGMRVETSPWAAEADGDGEFSAEATQASESTHEADYFHFLAEAVSPPVPRVVRRIRPRITPSLPAHVVETAPDATATTSTGTSTAVSHDMGSTHANENTAPSALLRGRRLNPVVQHPRPRPMALLSQARTRTTDYNANYVFRLAIMFTKVPDSLVCSDTGANPASTSSRMWIPDAVLCAVEKMLHSSANPQTPVKIETISETIVTTVAPGPVLPMGSGRPSTPALLILSCTKDMVAVAH